MENLDNYLEGKLNPEEMNKTTKRLIHGKFSAEKKRVWATELAEQYDIHRTTTLSEAKIRRLPFLLKAVAAAALLLLSIPILNMFFSASPQLALVEEQLKIPFPNNETRKGENDFEELKATAITAYNQTKYTESIAAYEQIVEQGKADENIFLFLGLSHLYQRNGELSKAIQNLQLANAQVSKKYEQETSWFLSLAWLKNGEVEKAKKELTKIVSNQGWKYKEARKILSKEF